jgi:hypothetical protein
MTEERLSTVNFMLKLMNNRSFVQLDDIFVFKAFPHSDLCEWLDECQILDEDVACDGIQAIYVE